MVSSSRPMYYAQTACCMATFQREEAVKKFNKCIYVGITGSVRYGINILHDIKVEHSILLLMKENSEIT